MPVLCRSHLGCLFACWDACRGTERARYGQFPIPLRRAATRCWHTGMLMSCLYWNMCCSSRTHCTRPRKHCCHRLLRPCASDIVEAVATGYVANTTGKEPPRSSSPTINSRQAGSITGNRLHYLRMTLEHASTRLWRHRGRDAENRQKAPHPAAHISP